MTQTRMPGPQRREQILDTCRRIAAEDGFTAVTIDRVASECAVSRTVIHQHFRTLPGMLVSLLDREIERAGRGFLDAVSSVPAARQHSIREITAAVLAAVDADPATWRLFMLPSPGGPPELHERLETGRAVVRAYLISAIETATGDADPQDAELAARILHAAADEIVRLRLRDPHTYNTERLLRQADRLQAVLHRA
ncbi:TetR/AcrR family transcriptional regulator [Nocardia sp. NPDC005825]|uniref:TetR/AcrR family transcriptional regulator n=1 Tax=unclassified Nocardia TaxID=2637762 RepID=UPI003402758C